ncbi:MAG: helix-turn-helix domain-containing protein, partial [Candidatus Hydrothermia bacterium]
MGLRKFIEALGRRDGLIMCAIISMKNPSNAQLTRATGYSSRSVQRAINKLVSEGFLIRSMRGRRRRLAPAPGLIANRLFVIPQEDLEYLFGIYGQDRVSEAIRVLEFT